MQFYGIDRSRVSLRLSALDRITRAPFTADVGRLCSVVPADVSVPLTMQQTEVILALSRGACAASAAYDAQLSRVLRAILMQSMRMTLQVPVTFDVAAEEAYLNRLGSVPSREIAKCLTAYFLKSGDSSVLDEFFRVHDATWPERSSFSVAQSRAFLGALLGLLEGVTLAGVAIPLNFVTRAAELCTTQFLAPAHQLFMKSTAEDAAAEAEGEEQTVGNADFSVAKLWLDVAEVYKMNATSQPSSLPQLAEGSLAMLEQLDSAHEFNVRTNPAQAIVLEQAMAAHFRVLQLTFVAGQLPVTTLQPLVLRVLHDSTLRQSELAELVGELSAQMVGSSEVQLADVLALLPEFFGELTSATAYHSAKRFADIYRVHFPTESHQIKMLYSLTNKLTAEEFSVYGARGEDAVAVVASLLSALLAFVASFDSSELARLVITLLDQKYGTINIDVDGQIIETMGLLTPYLSEVKFREALELLSQCVLYKGKPAPPSIVAAVQGARMAIVSKGPDDQVYLCYLLNLFIIKGDPNYADLARNIFLPLAQLTKHLDCKPPAEMARNMWFSLASMGFTENNLTAEDRKNLGIVARWAPTLVSETSADHTESDLQLNPVLCRGTNAEVLKTQTNALAKVDARIMPTNASPVEKMFFASTLLLEGLRARAGVISKLPLYFSETEFGAGEGYSQMFMLAQHLVTDYVRNMGYASGGLLAIALELKELLVLACHRVEAVRRVATEFVTVVVNGIPAALCQREALFTILDCLTLLGDSVSNAIEDEYSPKAVFTAPITHVTLELGDSLDSRRQALSNFEASAKVWVAKIASMMAPDLRSKVYTYLSSSKTNGRGRRFALNILASDDTIHEDFMAQYLALSHYDAQIPTQSVAQVVLLLQSAQSATDLQSAYVCAAELIRSNGITAIMLAEESVRASFRIFDEPAISAGIMFWHHIVRHQFHLRAVIMNAVTEQCVLTTHQHRGVFSRELDAELPLWTEMEYAPTNKHAMDREEMLVKKNLAPHTKLLTGFLRSGMHNSVLLSPLYIPMFTRLALAWLRGLIANGSLHSLARNLRLQILNFAEEMLNTLVKLQHTHPALKSLAATIERLIVRSGLAWFEQPVCQWPFGSNNLTEAYTLRLIRHVINYVHRISSPDADLLAQLLAQEFNKLSVWHNPLDLPIRLPTRDFGVHDLHTAWGVSPTLAVRLVLTWQTGAHELRWLQELVAQHPLAVKDCQEALGVYLNTRRPNVPISYEVLYWHQVSPIASIELLGSRFCCSKVVLQYALRSLQSHPITKCFFYVPQIVQMLRHDESGMVEAYILEAAKFSRTFAHHIIWNILANMYNDDDGTEPNAMKPQLDAVLAKLKAEFTPEEKQYYETEFKFFDEVTGISGKLKPFIKKSKAEKKEKIDEEMAKIKVPRGVYLPSHPDGTVIDIDRKSGKPLQSHAKAPFLATFKIQVDVDEVNEDNVMEVSKSTKELWQGAIFKVGDDCRQDVLALQIISVFRSIFNCCGLDVYVFPYKVMATAAGRGIIDVLPNSISRDMLGREAVNGLDQWYHSKHGGPDSIDFQRARLNFVKSLAAYSVISYLIQFKDRHNGNIMYDNDGHIVHIDFGFCFDIVPGGVKFEAAPFKLTKEMVMVMGGSPKTLPYRWFEELCVRAFLASRVFVDDICRVVEPMLESGLPCFKGHTIKRMRERFALSKTDAEAAQFMRSLISKSHESNYTKGYDEFQRITNGIPH